MAKRIFRAVCLISLWVFAASVVIIMWVLYDYYSETQRTQLKRQTNQVYKRQGVSDAPFRRGLPHHLH